MVLPTEAKEPTSINPNILLIYSAPKTGKTTICAQLPKSLILECEPPGASFVKANYIDLNTANEFNQALDALDATPAGTYDYLIVDTVSRLSDWSEWRGTYNYMITSQGQKFNRIGEVPKGKMMLPSDPGFMSVHSLPNGSGYQYSRDVMISWYERLHSLIVTKKVKGVILLAHQKDKQLETKAGNLVDSVDLDLTGKVKGIYCSRVDAVGYMTRKGKECVINFNNENKAIMGGRSAHVDGEIVISEKQEDGTIKTFWERIFKTI
jgi:hypothetical protein